MNKFLIFIFIILFVSISSFGISDIVITYKSGACMVDVKGNGKWIKAQVDMKLNTKSVIKTGKDGEIEVDINGERISIGKDTIVGVNYIMENVQEKKKMTWFSKLSNILNTVVKAEIKHAKTALMGLRGKIEDEEEIGWMGDLEEEDLYSRFKNGMELYEEQDYVQAINIFKDIIDEEELSSMRGEIAFYLGSSLFNNVQYKEALPYLQESIKNKKAYYYEVALINYSFSHYLSKNYSRAIDGFKTYIEEFREGQLEPYVLLMLGKSHKALGEKGEAKRYFAEIEKKYKDTEVYYDANQEMREL